MKILVMSLGGSIIVPEEIDTKFVKEFRELIIDFVKKGNKAVIVCGGGKTCRKYINAAREMSPNAPDTDFDKLGVKTTEVNAELLKIVFRGYSHEKVHSDYNKKIEFKKILFSAGLVPGTSTDFDAVKFAGVYNADTVVNMSDIDYVYDKDPTKYKDAKPLKEISWQDFRKIVGGTWKAGLNFPFDPIASKEAEKNKIKVVILNGRNLKNLKSFLEGKKFIGTVIS